MGGWLQDIRFALRQIRKNPGFALTAIVVLGVGLGATGSKLSYTGLQCMIGCLMFSPEFLVLVASAIAIVVPARRAASVEPMVALRYE